MASSASPTEAKTGTSAILVPAEERETPATSARSSAAATASATRRPVHPVIPATETRTGTSLSHGPGTAQVRATRALLSLGVGSGSSAESPLRGLPRSAGRPIGLEQPAAGRAVTPTTHRGGPAAVSAETRRLSPPSPPVVAPEQEGFPHEPPPRRPRRLARPRPRARPD